MIDDDYVIGFNGSGDLCQTSHMGWDARATDIGKVELSQFKSDAMVFVGNFNLKSGIDRIYDRMRFGNFGFDHLEIFNIN
jgi:hypothetical protein